MRHFLGMILACMMAFSFAACGSSAAADPANTTGAAPETTEAAALEETTSAETAAEAELLAILKDAAAGSETGTTGASLKNGRYAARILDWCGHYQNTTLEQSAAEQFAAALDTDALALFQSEQLPAIYSAAQTLTDGNGTLLNSIGYAKQYDWGDAEAAFSPLYAAVGMTMEESCGPACGGDVQEITDLMPYALDWDSDGEAETISFYKVSAQGDDKQTAVRLQDGASVWEYQTLNLYWNPTAYLADVDQDDVMELFVSGDVASDDYQTYCWKLQKDGPQVVHFAEDVREGDSAQTLYGLGSFAGLADGKKILLNSTVYLLGTYGGVRPYLLTDGVIDAEPGSIWDLAGNEQELTTIAELPAHLVSGRNGQDLGETVTISIFTKLTLTGSDAESAVWFVTADGVYGRFDVEKAEYGWMVGGLTENSAFEALPYAD